MQPQDVRFAFFVMVHHKPYQFEWLLNAIYNPDDLFLVHVDLKSILPLKRSRRGVYAAVKRLIADKPNVRLLRPRFTNWGGWSLSKVMLDAVANLLARDSRWTHFIDLSGQCYPTASLDEIRRRLSLAPDRQFIELRPFSTLPDDDWHLRRKAMVEVPLKAIALPGARLPPPDFEVATKGSQWVMLTRPFCEWLNASPASAKIVRYLRHMHLSDELVFQTLVLNSPFAAQVSPHYGRAIIWPGPKTLTLENHEALTRPEVYFGRKFDAAVDVEILRKLAGACGFAPGPPGETAAGAPSGP